MPVVTDGPFAVTKKRSTDKAADRQHCREKDSRDRRSAGLGQSRRGGGYGAFPVRVAGLEARLEALGHSCLKNGGNITVA